MSYVITNIESREILDYSMNLNDIVHEHFSDLKNSFHEDCESIITDVTEFGFYDSLNSKYLIVDINFCKMNDMSYDTLFDSEDNLIEFDDFFIELLKKIRENKLSTLISD